MDFKKERNPRFLCLFWFKKYSVLSHIGIDSSWIYFGFTDSRAGWEDWRVPYGQDFDAGDF